MKNRALGKRYAKALMELAVEQGAVDKAEADLRLIADAISENEELSAVLLGQFEPRVKQDVFSRLFADRVSALTLNFVRFVISKRREQELLTIIEVFRELYYEHCNLIDVSVTASAELPDAELSALKEKLEEVTGKRVLLRMTIDPDLLGGLRVKLGDLVIDGSVRARLEMVARRLQTTSV